MVAVELWGLWIFVRVHGENLLYRLARAKRRWSRRSGETDPLQAAVDSHWRIEAPHGALAVAVVTPAADRQFYAGRVRGCKSPAPDASTRFEIASITKTFTATLLHAMQCEGMVRADTALDDLLEPDARLGGQSPRSVTLADLAVHHSGLPRVPQALTAPAQMLLAPRQPYALVGLGTLRRWLRGRRVRNVGVRYRYSNLGYGVLGLALAKRAMLDYDQALRRFVLDPLGLFETGTDATALAQPHHPLGWPMPAWRMGPLAGAGGLRSSLKDMMRWLKANMTLQPPIDATLHEPRMAAHGGNRIAAGWHVTGDGNARVVWHNGSTGGSSSFIAFIPGRGVGVVVLSAQAVSVDRLGMQLLRMAAGG